MIPCPGCGSSLTYDIKSASMLCSYCGRSYEPYQFDSIKKDAEKQDMDVAVYSCPSCGAELVTDSNDLSTVCSYCGGANLIFDRMEKQLRPEKIIPFSITKEEAIRLYKKRAQKAFFTSGKYRRDSVVDDFRCIYMPFWSYTAHLEGMVKIETETTSRDGDYIVTKRTPHTAILNAVCSGMSHDASKSFDDTLSECLAPYSAEKQVEFTPGYLCGIYADNSDMPKSFYAESAADLAKAYVHNRALKESNISDGTVQIPGVKKLSAARVLYPVWFLSVRTGRGISYAAVNGSTGKVAADFPMSIPRVLSFSILLAAVFFLLLNTVFMPTPLIAVIASCLLTCIGLFVNWRELCRFYYRDIYNGKLYLDEKDGKKRKGISFFGFVSIVCLCMWVCSLVFLSDLGKYFPWLFFSPYIIIAVAASLNNKGKFKRLDVKFREMQHKLFASPAAISEKREKLLNIHTALVIAFFMALVFIPLIFRLIPVYTAVIFLSLIFFLCVLYLTRLAKSTGNIEECRGLLIWILLLVITGSLSICFGKPINQYYYCWSIGCIAAFLVLFSGTLYYHAQLGKRRPPQFEKGEQQK